MFNRERIIKLLIPLIIEQFLAVLVGLADTIMISHVSENAVSGVSLVDSINILIIMLLSALATGGAIVCSQSIGADDRHGACKAASQLLLVTFSASMLLAVISVVFNRQLLSVIFGTVNTEIMQNAVTYFYITALSFPFLAVYNVCAAIYRAMGNSKTSMMTSLIMNSINIIGNAICVYGLSMGVEGVAYPTLISRVVAAVIMLCIIRNPVNTIYISPIFRPGFDWQVIKKIMRIGIPNGLENSLFHFAKLILQSLISTLGTTSIAAYAVANNLIAFLCVPGSAFGMGLMTIVGQCAGAGEYKQARAYTWRLIFANIAFFGVSFIIVILFGHQMLAVYNLSPASEALSYKLIYMHSFMAFLWPFAFPLGQTLRAASDVKYTMYVSGFSVWAFRIGLSYLFVRGMNMSIIGIWIAMFIDWAFRAICFTVRICGNKWEGRVKV